MSLEEMVKKYVITSAQNGASPNKELLKNIDLYAKNNNAEVLVLPMAGKSVLDDRLHKEMQLYKTITTDYSINENIKISNFEIKPQQILPLTGIKRFAQGEKSFIFASPKQCLEYVANSYDAIPKAIMTTGACTKPRYNTTNRIGRIAERDHEYGFIIVEKVSNKIYHFRQIKALSNGSFYDIDGHYKDGKFSKLKETPAFIVGDLHPYDTDPLHQKVTFDQMKHLKPKKVFLHDTFNGTSISHHYKGHNIKMFEISKQQGLSLEKELLQTAVEVQKYLEYLPKGGELYLVASNHDEHLYRYLDEGRFIGDKGNDLIASKLYTQALQGINPLMYGLSLYMLLPKNLHYIERNTDHKVLGYQLGHHGDLGSNGGKGSLRSIEEANGKSVTAHGHSAGKIRNTYKVGTSTKLRLGYNKGYSNWTQTNGVLMPDGNIILLNTIKGKWRV